MEGKSVHSTTLKSKAERKAFERSLAVHSVLVLITLPVIYFFYWLVHTSLVNMQGEVSMRNWQFLFGELNLDSVIVPYIWPVLWFTVKFALICTVIDILVVVPAAYAFSRLSFPGKRTLLKCLFFLNAFPSNTIIIAIFFMMVKLGLVNTLPGVVIVCVTMMAPNHVYMLKGFFDDIPWDYEWAALVDGCTRFQSFRQVILPSATNGIGVIFIFAFLRAYSEWFLIKILMFSVQYQTLAKLMQNMLMQDVIVDYGVLAALAIFFTIPVAIFYMVSQNQLMKISNLGGKKLA